MKYAYIALAGAVLAGDAAAFAPACPGAPSLRAPGVCSMKAAVSGAHAESLSKMGYSVLDPAGATTTLSRKPAAASGGASASASTGAQAPPPAKLELPKAKLEAAAVNAKQWGAGDSAASAASAGTQAPPPAKLELPKAKLEAAAVNEKQWGAGDSAASAPAAPSSGGFASYMIQVPWKGGQTPLEKSADAAKPAEASKPKAAEVVIKESPSSPWSVLDSIRVPYAPKNAAKAAAPAASSGTQAAPPAKLELPKAKLEAASINAKQWGVGGAAMAAGSANTMDVTAAQSKLEADFAAASAAGAAALPRAIESQQEMNSIKTSYVDKLKAVASAATSKLGSGAKAPISVGPNDLSKFREESLNDLRKKIAQ